MIRGMPKTQKNWEKVTSARASAVIGFPKKAPSDSKTYHAVHHCQDLSHVPSFYPRLLVGGWWLLGWFNTTAACIAYG
jgi:hypothetical protein